jgi:hypothetical protein
MPEAGVCHLGSGQQRLHLIRGLDDNAVMVMYRSW